jgi:hypothetical protein
MCIVQISLLKLRNLKSCYHLAHHPTRRQFLQFYQHSVYPE